MKPVTDKAEVSIDFPGKAYIGSFGRESGFEVRAADDDVELKLLRPGEERREVAVHLHYYLLADIIAELARALAERPPIDEAHGEPLRSAADALARAVGRKPRRGKERKR